MLESAKERWSTLNKDSKRVILAIVGLTTILSIVVIATVSKSASIKEPRSDSIWTNIRLPASVRPSLYNVKLKIDMTAERFTGTEDVYVTVSETTAVLLIHINDVYDDKTGQGAEMNITDYSVTSVEKVGEEYNDLEDKKVKHAFPYSQNSFFVMKMKQYIQPGEYKLSFAWESRLVRGLDGIYLSTYEYVDSNNESVTYNETITKKLLASQMEPLAARKVMPCFDEPDMKAKFTMEITTEKEYPLVLWNMPLVDEPVQPVDMDDTWQTHTFERSVVMSSYLLAFIVADFTCTDYAVLEGIDVKVRTCGRPDQIESKAGDYATVITAKIIKEYETFYGVPFPLDKIDSVAVPDFSAGAMENWGLILYRETALLYNPDKDTFNNKARVNTVVAHELAHQWFGNLVTMKWWNDLWLNEGFASYVEWIGTDASEPFWHYKDFQTYSDRARALAIDSYVSSRPTSIAVEKPSDITAQFDSISYSKGSALLVQAKMFMDPESGGDKNFEEAIRNYIERYKFNNTVQEQLYDEMNTVYQNISTDLIPAEEKVNIVDVMNTWTLQMNFPVVNVERYDADNLVISQQRFLISGSDVSDDKTSPYGYQWYVPVEYSVNGGATEFKWLKPHSSIVVPFNFSLDSSYIRLNPNSAGYYITNYDFDTWTRFSTHYENTANYGTLTISERQGLLFETFLLISAGKKPMSVGMELLALMTTNEDADLVPIREISRQISGITVHIRNNKNLTTSWRKEWKSFAEKLYSTADASGSKPSDYLKLDSPTALPADDADGNFQRRLLITFAVQLACAYEVEDCVTAATQRFDNYRSNSSLILPVDFKSTILDTVMSKEGASEDDWDFLWNKYLESDQATEKEVIYYALGQFQDEDVLKKFSNYCLNTTLVRTSDALYIMGRSIAYTALGAEVSWQFMQDNWDRLTSDFQNALFAADAYISGVLSSFSNPDTLAEIEVFFAEEGKKESLGAAAAAYDSSIQSIKANIAWLNKHEESIQSFVDQPDQ